jgi:hypothetical protein
MQLLHIFLLVLLFAFSYKTKEYLKYPFMTEPQIEKGEEFFIKTLDGRYISACSGCLPNVNLKNRCSYYLCANKYALQSSVFKMHKHIDGFVSIETIFGEFWKRCSGCVEFCHDVICADGKNKNLGICKFHVIKNRNGTVSFRNDMGRLLELCPCGDEDKCGKLMCSLGAKQENTQFIIEFVPKTEPDPILQFIKFKPAFQREFDPRFLGVSLSNVQ